MFCDIVRVEDPHFGVTVGELEILKYIFIFRIRIRIGKLLI